MTASNHHALPATDADIANAIAAARGNPASTRLNVGIAGRGKELSPHVVSRIQALAGYYSGVDFAAIGIASGCAISAPRFKAA